jgi:hypothetical protein
MDKIKPLVTATATAMAPECPLWVISGHAALLEKASALPSKADIARHGHPVG